MQRVRWVLLFAVVLASCGKNPSAEFAGTWFDTQGKSVPELVLSVRLGPKQHCDMQSIAFMTLGWPVGSPRQGKDFRSFVRDPQGLLRGFGFDSLEIGTHLPSSAVSSGFHRGRWTLWVTPSDDNRVYLVSHDRVERWPTGGVGCF
jgi:hypothetical protein